MAAAATTLDEPWGKLDRNDTSRRHHLAHHCADVAACFRALLSSAVVRSRMAVAAGRALSEVEIARLTALVFLHDVGKLHPGFQARGWDPNGQRPPLAGHVNEGLEIFLSPGVREHPALAAFNLDDFDHVWGVSEGLLRAVVSHHGRPAAQAVKDLAAVAPLWRAVGGYDPIAAARALGDAQREWFAEAFQPCGPKLPDRPAFEHLICGLTTLADWMGSDERRFPFRAELERDYWGEARRRADEAWRAIGLDASRQRARMPAAPSFSDVTGFAAPNPAQALVGSIGAASRLVILEFETGSGKTEAALWRYAQLLEAGEVDALYFAVPTRAAASQLHRRVAKATRRIFGDADPEPLLAAPGYLRAGDAEGRALPDWRVLWDDADDEATLARRWAAEHSKRYLAAQIAVGTVDQAMLAALRVKHAHLRGAALSRSLLVIDEVHASDAWMTAIQKTLLDAHLALGGHAMLMSATLGSVARSSWLGAPQPSRAAATAEPYPAVWVQGETKPLRPAAEVVREKRVSMALVEDMSAEAAAAPALEAARRGARVLVIRNIVSRAVETLDALESRMSPGDVPLLFRVGEVATLHHSRFAPEDRKRLDEAVEDALSTKPDRAPGGRIVIGTQTLEQSLDIDADLLVTDLCPVDVLLQRIGRLHRHALPRPEGFEAPRCLVLSPEGGLHRLTATIFENGLGAWEAGGMLQGVYLDLAVLELTRRLARDRNLWVIPSMNRELVETATHPNSVSGLLDELGPDWVGYWRKVIGLERAQSVSAQRVSFDRERPFKELAFPADEERIRTRLGAESARIGLPEPTPGPFGAMVTELPIPPRVVARLDLSSQASAEIGPGGEIRLTIDGSRVVYGRRGVTVSSG